MSTKKPGKREQRATDGAAMLAALGIAARAEGDAIKTNVGTITVPQRDGAAWVDSRVSIGGYAGGYRSTSATLDRCVESSARSVAHRARSTIQTERGREAKAIKEAADARAIAERAERALAAAEDTLAKILAATGDAP
jgi:hypothetical protein